MNFDEFLDFVIDDGIEACRLDYCRSGQEMKLQGSIKGFEECRHKNPLELAALLKEANAKIFSKLQEGRASGRQTADYWYWRHRHAEIEWVCNVASVVLINEGIVPIIQPSSRAVIKAAEIVGVKAQSSES